MLTTISGAFAGLTALQVSVAVVLTTLLVVGVVYGVVKAIQNRHNLAGRVGNLYAKIGKQKVVAPQST